MYCNIILFLIAQADIVMQAYYESCLVKTRHNESFPTYDIITVYTTLMSISM